MNRVNINLFILRKNWVYLIAGMEKRDALAVLVPVLGFAIGRLKLINIFSGVSEKTKKLQESIKISS
jgi:hypothetical protein